MHGTTKMQKLRRRIENQIDGSTFAEAYKLVRAQAETEIIHQRIDNLEARKAPLFSKKVSQTVDVDKLQAVFASRPGMNDMIRSCKLQTSKGAHRRKPQNPQCILLQNNL